MKVNQSRQRVVAALSFEQPDVLPLWDHYWPEFIEQWRAAKGLLEADDHAIDAYYGNDVLLSRANEEPWPSQAAKLEGGEAVGAYSHPGRAGTPDEEYSISRNGWGAVVQMTRGSYFSKELSVALEERVDPDTLVFENPRLESRYKESDAIVRKWGRDRAIFAKTGGPFRRASFLRGYEQFLIDFAEDPDWVRSLVEHVMAHLTAVGVEQIRRSRPILAGIQINDDCCSLRGPLISPRAYESICLPSLRRMVRAYKEAGVPHVCMHCDGNVMRLVEMWVDAGIDSINPCEPRAGVDVFALRETYGRKLAFAGAMDNCIILPRGDRGEIETHIRRLAELGQDGGLVLGGHSIGPDISIESYEWAMATRRKYGTGAYKTWGRT